MLGGWVTKGKKSVKSQVIGMGDGRGFRMAGGTCVEMTSVSFLGFTTTKAFDIQ